MVPQKDIRVLQILPGRRNSPIYCVLLTSALADSDGNSKSKSIKLEYTALSHHWGDDHAVHEIYIYSNEEFGEDWDAVWPFSTRFIQKNLREALLQSGSEYDELQLWCDAMCVNQANYKEKATQVARMHEVYTFAKKVCVWLGTNNEQGATDGPKLTFNLLRSILDLGILDWLTGKRTEKIGCLLSRMIGLQGDG
ncbi:hypothetical protein EAF00_006040 [Botryotinia globosa]|nr:hypothetical protein EAF00_006040 [Botryotinia globosa]